MPSENENTIEWKIEEKNFAPKTTEWFWALGIVAASLIIFSILLKNYLFIIIVFLAVLIFYLEKNKSPKIIVFRLDSAGVRIDDKLYSYDNFVSFWIFSSDQANTNENSEIALRRKQRLSPLLIVPFYSRDEIKIKRALATRLAEKEEQESLLDLLRKRFF